MVFSSNIFLFLFLPLVLAAYGLIRRELRNALLLFASLLFYSWGEAPWVMLCSVTLNYVAGLLVERLLHRQRIAWTILAFTVTGNLGLIAEFKYRAFLATNVNMLLAGLHLNPIPVFDVALPLGISFFTFHAMSYVIDIYRGQARAMRNPIDMALYIAFFPQLIAGPIIRYHEIAAQITHRQTTLPGFASGIRRFVFGLGKKMLLANTLAIGADSIFALPADRLPANVAWLAIACYTLQIYFDFSGYTDMAIGMGQMFGFTFPENFNYPYVASSVTDFWRRWHMSLSRWFRDYLYIPLGGNRRGPLRTCFNLLIVFFLCGLWHGASWTFVIWGLFHGAFLGVERLFPRRRADAVGQPAGSVIAGLFGHGYTLLIVMVGWLIFRAPDLPYAMGMLRAMAGLGHGDPREYHCGLFLTNELVLVLIVGAFASIPWAATAGDLAEVETSVEGSPNAFAAGPKRAAMQPTLPGLVPTLRFRYIASTLVPIARLAFLSIVFALSVCKLATGTHNPFIYFRF